MLIEDESDVEVPVGLSQSLSCWIGNGSQTAESPELTGQSYLACDIDEMLSTLEKHRNFDIIAGTDLTNPYTVRKVFEYIKMVRPLVVVMAPVCTPYSPLGRMNQIINQDAWRRSLRIAEPIAKLCGEIALIQLSGNRHYLVEQPTGSTLFKVVPWPTVVRDRRSLSIAFDQCQVGQSAGGYPAKKSTELVASSQELLKPFVGRTCPGIHQHQVLTGRAASQAQKWPREMCQMIAFGIEQLVRAELRKMKKEQAYPTVASDTSDPKGDSAVEESPWRKCKGCLWRLQKFDSRHSRVPGECKHPDLEAIEFKCPGCMKGLPRSNELHDYGPDCRHALTTRRTGTRRRPFSRVPAEEEPTSKLKASELGKADEASAAAADAAEPASSSAAAAGQPSALPDEHA